MSIFNNAKSIPAPEKGKGKKPKKAEVKMPGLEQLAEVDALIKNLLAFKEGLDHQVKNSARDIFIAAGKSGKRPENFRGVEGEAEASIEFRKRSTRSPLTENEVAEFAGLNIPVETIQDVSETFVINPEYAADSKLLGQIDKALKGVKGLPSDFILRQEGSARQVVSDETIDAVFSKGIADKFFDNIGVLAIKPKFEVADVAELAKKVSTYLKGE